jgi:hypothetical protein
MAGQNDHHTGTEDKDGGKGQAIAGDRRGLRVVVKHKPDLEHEEETGSHAGHDPEQIQQEPVASHRFAP